MTAGFLPAPSLGCGQPKPWRDRAHPRTRAGVDGDRFRLRIDPWGQAKMRNMHASSHLSISCILQCGCSCCGRLRCRGERNEPFQPLDVPDEAEHLRHEIGFELYRRPDVAVPRSAVPGCAVAKADVARSAMGDGFFTGSDEIGLTFGEALAPDSDGFAKPAAVERRLEPGRGE
jgi:hypothetical protein